ncbi:MAG TPA: BACON domain-containing carbohydrate-binding protein, partial [Blastocatellia bacterium]|nr:BACON domain-containing carbohydrate-binding protein [Blastocatellia bacterium]
ASGGSGTISVTVGAGCGWEAVSRVDWLTITSSHSSIGTGTVSYTVAANTSGVARKGKIIVGEQVFAVKQKAN